MAVTKTLHRDVLHIMSRTVETNIMINDRVFILLLLGKWNRERGAKHWYEGLLSTSFS